MTNKTQNQLSKDRQCFQVRLFRQEVHSPTTETQMRKETILARRKKRRPSQVRGGKFERCTFRRQLIRLWQIFVQVCIEILKHVRKSI